MLPQGATLRTQDWRPLTRDLLSPGNIVLGIGALVLVVPTMIGVARFSWATEQGAHGPLVLASGAWLLWRELKHTKAPLSSGKLIPGGIALAAMLLLYVFARIIGTIELEAFAMYGALIGTAYLLVGGRLLRSIWFPLVYLAFTLPPPETVVAAVTQPIKIVISEFAVTLLHAVGYPIASSGVTIQIAQHELLVAAACAGLNSLVTLSALCLFYVYLRHRSNPAAFLIVCLAVVPIALFSNFVRVVVLVLITYHFGEAAAQGFLHDFAGLLMFAVALFTIFLIDHLATPLIRRAGEQRA